MSRDYEPYSEYQKRKKKKKINYLRAFIFLLILVLLMGGMYWGAKAFYRWLVPGTDNTATAKPNAQVTTQNKASDAKTSETDKAASNTTTNGVYDPLYGNAKYLIHIHKKGYQLDLYEKGKADPIKSYGVAVAKNAGDKKREGDNTTPVSWGNAVAIPKSYAGAKVGVPSTQVPFRVEEIIDASSWSHDFHDGNGVIEKAYGPWFISLDTGWDGIGIHGTHDPNSIGTNASEGCIRLRNEDVRELRNIIYSHNKGIGTRVIITED